MRTYKWNKRFFYISILIAFGMIFIFNALTPAMSDDLFYGKEVSSAGSILDIVKQEYNQYMTWSGRSVCHLILRLFLSGNKMIFNVFNSIIFVLLALLIYWSVEHKKKYDICIFVLINLFLWFFGVIFRQTILWETGACNYLWGSTIIMSFITCYRYALKNWEDLRHNALWTILLPVLGILAGWCNENTSGGGLLLVLILTGIHCYERKGIKGNIRPWMITGLVGQFVGFLFMILAPGNFIRGQFTEEEHSGIFGLISRFQKMILAVRANFFVLLLIGLLLFVIIKCQKKSWQKVWKVSRNGIIWMFIFMATCMALVLTPEPMPRAYFGAGVFLTVGVVQFFVDVEEKEIVFQSMKSGLIAVMSLIMFFTYGSYLSGVSGKRNLFGTKGGRRCERCDDSVAAS